MPLKIGEPRDRQLVVTTHEMALNELRITAIPYAKVATDEDDGAGRKDATMTFTAEPGTLAHFGPVEIAGNKSVGERVIERELRFKPGDLYRRSVVQESQRRLYGMELFQFVNIEPLNPEQQPTEVPMRVTVAEGKHQRVNFGVGYGTEEKGARRRRVPPPEFSRRRALGRRARALVVARSRRAPRLQPAVFLRAPFLARCGGAALVHLHARLPLDGHRRARRR